MARVGKDKRLRRQARLAGRAQAAANYVELAKSFEAYMREHGLGGEIYAGPHGVTITSASLPPGGVTLRSDIRAFTARSNND